MIKDQGKRKDGGGSAEIAAPKRHPCGVCGKLFAFQSKLATHGAVHTGARNYACLQCGKRFTENSSLTKHKRLHTGIKPYQCGDCGKSFNENNHLTTHRRIHTGETPYSCDQCHRAFASSSDLTKHLPQHADGLPFVCQICECGFQTPRGLSLHLAQSHGDFACDNFLATFSSPARLLAHFELRHFPPASFMKIAHSTNLLLVHAADNVEAPFQCLWCGWCFASALDFVDHIWRHKVVVDTLG